MWKTVYLDEASVFIQSLHEPVISKIFRTVDLLEKFGYRIGMPHSKKITSNLFELRIRGVDEIRFLYTYKGNKIYIVHGFRKKSQKIPSREIKTAINRINTLTRV